MKVYYPYLTKDHLQSKRFTAQSMGTSYVYDFPEIFNQTLKLEWESFVGKNSPAEVCVPSELMVATELILTPDESGLEEVNRVPGLNNVSTLVVVVVVVVVYLCYYTYIPVGWNGRLETSIEHS